MVARWPKMILWSNTVYLILVLNLLLKGGLLGILPIKLGPERVRNIYNSQECELKIFLTRSDPKNLVLKK